MNITKEIQNTLSQIETEKKVHIILAVESGSRAWGFPSTDSDYDVRIFYHHSPEWYCSVFNRKDHLSVPMTDELDIVGWDLRKVLRLLYRGNATVHEWLRSPEVYRVDSSLSPKLRAFADSVFDPAAAFRHYYAMATKKLHFENQSLVTAKSLLYGYRTLLCARWVFDHQQPPPMVFQEMLKHYLSPGDEVLVAIEEIIKKKAVGRETDLVNHKNPAYLYSQNMLKFLRGIKLHTRSKDAEKYERFFSEFLQIL